MSLRLRVGLGLLCGLAIAMQASAAPAPPVLPAVPARAQFDAAHRVEFTGLISPINSAPGTPNPAQGYLFRPAGPGPFPAVVMVSGCTGLLGMPGYRRWVDRLTSWGYVALAVDSLGTRAAQYCENRMVVDRYTVAGDAYGALRYLAQQPYVQPHRIAEIGYSYGANALMVGIESSGQPDGGLVLARLYPAVEPYRFAAAIAFYPTLVSRHLRFGVPLLILDGDGDRWDNWPELMWLAETGKRLGDATQLHIYPAATHGFDMEENVAGGQIEMRFDPEATADAAERAHAFLKRYLE